jgi:hypothetical protein
VQPGELIGTGGDEHVAMPADEFADRDVVQAQGTYEFRIVAGQLSGVLFGHDDGRVSAAEQVVLRVFNDGLDSQLLGRGRGGQVVVAFHLRGVVGVDGRPPLPGPRARVAHGVVRGPDPRPVNLQ